MSMMFERKKSSKNNDGDIAVKGCAVPDVSKAEEQKDDKVEKKFIWLFLLLFMVLISGTLPNLQLEWRLALVSLFSLATVAWALKMYTRDENKQWMNETWFFTKTIFPLLLIGVFIAGILAKVIPGELVATYVGDNSVSANSIATGFGLLMYFPTLVEVTVAEMFLGLGMARGPLLAYLLAGPTMSLQSIFVVQKMMGKKKTLAYVMLMAVFCVLGGLMFGWVFG